MRDRWDWRALVLFLFLVTAAVVVVEEMSRMYVQLDVFRRQIDTTNQHLATIQRQECLDANESRRQFAATTHHPVVYRVCH